MIPDRRLHEIARRVAQVPGVRAVVLGGSRARGTHHAGSDVDLGLYYETSTLDLAALTAAAREIGGPDVAVAGPGGWGPWVDGGAWLQVEGTAVDLILRDAQRVAQQRDRAIRGEFVAHAQTGHPLGFLDVAYAGEVATCRSLVDPEQLMPRLRAGLDPYPPALQEALIENLWTAEFLAAGAAKGVAKGDVAWIQMMCASALMWCAHAWHAAAGSWVTNEKGLIPSVAALALRTTGIGPAEFARRADAALRDLGSADPARPIAAVQELAARTRQVLSAAGAP
ncbi:nucleotidyltransferase domain-containing protein [Brachybacterium hainanense]|uniref:Nucleotidyltransferase domain-containing protein n=1 Tax=Brachybacterium hainanense TaxID=1541174 RepID=A0ABV6RG59_9MICO